MTSQQIARSYVPNLRNRRQRPPLCGFKPAGTRAAPRANDQPIHAIVADSGHRRPLLWATVLATGLILAGCSDSNNDVVSMIGSIAWQPCESESSLQCGTLTVPLIHDSTDRRVITLDLARLPATGSDAEPLVLNPGGPGGSGTELMRELVRVDTLPDSVRERFDIVSFDPRGVGKSDHIDCSDLGRDDIDEFAFDESSLAAIHSQNESFSQACAARYGDLLSWLGSNSVVKDMDLIRKALNADKLNFIGYSYGTRLAALYLQRFPENSGKIVLDGPLLPSGDIAPLVAGMATATRRNLDSLLDTCGTRVPDCNRAEIYDKMVTRILDGLAAEDQVTGIFVSILSEAALDPELADVVAVALIEYIDSGNAVPMLNWVSLLENMQPENEDLSLDGDTVERAVFCADDPMRPSLEDSIAVFTELSRETPLLARVLTPDVSMACAGWPASEDPVLPIATTTAPVSLVIGGVSDAQTPIEFAEPMADALGGRLLRSTHSGHVGLFVGKSDCVDAVGVEFLLNGTLPETDACRDVQNSGAES